MVTVTGWEVDPIHGWIWIKEKVLALGLLRYTRKNTWILKDMEFLLLFECFFLVGGDSTLAS